jgi:hypothetical protein
VSAAAWRAQALAEKIVPFLRGEGAEVQGATLADLLATWLAGHPNWIREEILQRHIEAVRSLISVNEQALFGGRGHPQNRSPS